MSVLANPLVRNTKIAYGFQWISSKKEQAQKLRKQGLSYSEILMQVPVSKDTLREQTIAGISLYAAEGTKTDRVREFTNADPEMIRFMANWMRKFCGVDMVYFLYVI